MVGGEGWARRWPVAAWLVAALLAASCATLVQGDPVAVEQRGGDQGQDQDQGSDGSGGEDPTAGIEGVLRIDYEAGQRHVAPPQRVAYDHLPPLGGAHDQAWAPCNGVVFTVAVRTEHFVHSLEHGAVWVTYNPDDVRGSDLEALAGLVDGEPYMVMSPFPGQEDPISVQSWGRQLKLDRGDDPRFAQFVTATRANPELSPEPGARCDELGPGLFELDSPLPFEAGDPGPDAVPVTGG